MADVKSKYHGHMEHGHCCVVCDMKQRLEKGNVWHLLIWRYQKCRLTFVTWGKEETFGVLIHLPITYSHHWGYKLTHKYNWRNISLTRKQGCREDEEKSQGKKKKKRKAQERRTLNGMADGVNMTVEAHWCLLPKREEQCDSTDVATGIAGRHSTFTGVLFSVSCVQIASEQTLTRLACIC